MKRSPIRRRRPSYPPSDLLQERTLWLAQQDRCAVCMLQTALDPHEIITRARATEWCQLFNFLAVCRGCHDVVLIWLPMHVQLALKKLSDPEHYDLQATLRLAKLAPTYITQGDVAQWAVFISLLRT